MITDLQKKKRGIWLNNYQTVAKEYAEKPSTLEVTNEMSEFKIFVSKIQYSVTSRASQCFMKIDTQMHIMKQLSDMIGWFLSVKDESIMHDIYDKVNHNWYKQLPPIPSWSLCHLKKKKNYSFLSIIRTSKPPLTRSYESQQLGRLRQRIIMCKPD